MALPAICSATSQPGQRPQIRLGTKPSALNSRARASAIVDMMGSLAPFGAPGLARPGGPYRGSAMTRRSPSEGRPTPQL